jgi:threonine dehydrogenase-like Zn-dependent dehydrogenase
MISHFDQLAANRCTGLLKPEGMITKKIKMSEVEEQGFKALVEDKDNQVKILIDIEAGV